MGLLRQLSGVQRLFTRPSRAFLAGNPAAFRGVFYTDRRCQKPVGKSHSAAARPYTLVGERIVTNSSAAVGCTAMVASKSALVAPILIAMPSTWTISLASGPTM